MQFLARDPQSAKALQTLDLATTAQIHLYKSLLKIKSIASAPSFPHHVQATVEATRKPLDTASANVQARLFKSSPVQTAMTEALSGIRAVLGIPDVRLGSKKRLRAKDYANIGPATVSNDGLSGKRRDAGEESNDEWSGLSSLEHTIEPGNVGGSEDDERDYEMYASRLAASSDEDSSTGESKSDGSHQQELNPEEITEESEVESEPRNPKPSNKPPPTAPKSTTFLPSLSLGGYWSGSESASDLSDTEPQPRKNRRGQQARRALWEKKFGKNANHLKMQAQNRDEGWDPRRGARDSDDRGKRGRGRGRGGMRTSRGDGGEKGRGRGPVRSGANSDPVSARKMKTATNAPLHPSWEAAKKAKEQKKTAAFQGKKVVFD